MNQLIEDCPMDNYIPVDHTQNSVADKEPVEVQCTPTSVVTAGSTTRMLWLKIKDALASLTTTVSGYINTAKASLEASINAAKTASNAASTAATGAKNSADAAKTAAEAAKDAIAAIDIPSSVASETSLLATKDQVESVLVALISAIHEDSYGNAIGEILVSGKKFILVGKDGNYQKYMCYNYSGLETIYTNPNPVVGGMSYKKNDSGELVEYGSISAVSYFSVARKTDIPTDYAKQETLNEVKEIVKNKDSVTRIQRVVGNVHYHVYPDYGSATVGTTMWIADEQTGAYYGTTTSLISLRSGDSIYFYCDHGYRAIAKFASTAEYRPGNQGTYVAVAQNTTDAISFTADEDCKVMCICEDLEGGSGEIFVSSNSGVSAVETKPLELERQVKANAATLNALKGKLVNSTTGTTIESAVNKVKDNVGNFADGKSAATELATISQELGNLSAIFSGITAQDITDEYNAE